MIKREVRARSFVIVDEDNRPRAHLNVGRGMGPMLRLFDDNGTTRASIALDADGSSTVNLYDASGESRVSLALIGEAGALTIEPPQGE